MKAEQKGNFSVAGRGGIALSGLLTRKPAGEIIVTPNAPTWLSGSDRAIVIMAVQQGANNVTINGEVLKIETTWERLRSE